MILNPITIDANVVVGSMALDADIGGLDMSIPADVGMTITIVSGHLEEMSATPSSETQVIVCDPGFDGISKVTIDPIPSNYGLVTYDGSIITVS